MWILWKAYTRHLGMKKIFNDYVYYLLGDNVQDIVH